MHIRPVLIVMALLTVAQAAHLRADEKKQHEDLVRTIVEGWRSRQQQVRTITCTSKVDSFYPKGYLSEVGPQKGVKQTQPFPNEDKKFDNESSSWAIDFTAHRVKKEAQNTEPFPDPDSPSFYLDKSLHLFAENKYRVFQPKNMYPNAGDHPGDFEPEVILYEGVSHMFAFSFIDLPILWVAGGVNGQLTTPEDMQRLESPDRFFWRGQADWNGHECMVLTVPEQLSKTAVREFWVGPKEGGVLS